MPVGLLTLEIQLPYAHSLKERRAVLRKMRDRLRSRFNVAVAELNHEDVWQRATLGVASISDSQPLLESARYWPSRKKSWVRTWRIISWNSSE